MKLPAEAETTEAPSGGHSGGWGPHRSGRYFRMRKNGSQAAGEAGAREVERRAHRGARDGRLVSCARGPG